jgi:hypothetical protein
MKGLDRHRQTGQQKDCARIFGEQLETMEYFLKVWRLLEPSSSKPSQVASL